MKAHLTAQNSPELLHQLAATVVRVMRARGALSEQAPPPRFTAASLQDRAVLLVDLQTFYGREERITDPQFARQLRATLDGRRVVITNSQGLAIQIGWRPQPTTTLPDYVALDLAQQPRTTGRLLVPLGQTARGPFWASLLDMDAVLIGGTRRLGKTNLLHSWLLALIAREPPRRLHLVLADGKGNVEFGVYEGLPHVRALAGDREALLRVLGDLRVELERRGELLRQAQEQGVCRKVSDLPTAQRPATLVIVVDELAYYLDGDEGAAIEADLRDLVARGGAYGIHPVIATQRPDATAVKGFLKTNLPTRLALPVPDLQDSRVILGRPGAERLPKIPGRLLTIWQGKPVVAQSYVVSDELLGAVVGRLQAGRAPVLPPLALTEMEARLVGLALENHEGFFPIRELAEAAGVSRRQVEALSKRWELQGMLAPVGYSDATGRKQPRQVTEALEQLYLAVLEAETRL